MVIPNVIVSYARIQEAFEGDPARINEAVYDGANAVAEGDSVERARLIAAWNNALGALESDDKQNVLSSPQNALASRLQTLISERAAAIGKISTLHKPQIVHTN